MLRIIVTIIFLSFTCVVYSQFYVSGTLAGGNSEFTVSTAYGMDWVIGKKKKIGIGGGVRFTSYAGFNRYYQTAPAELTSGKTGPLVLFTKNIEENIDTFLIKYPQVNSLNLFINLKYKFNEKIVAGFNIDAIGFSFGGKKQGNYINGFEGAMTSAKPTSFNLLLISDNDLGSLNSEFYLNYVFRERWAIKAAAQFHFTEYTTKIKVQQEPEPNDRFRNKSLLGAIGIVYQLK